MKKKLSTRIRELVAQGETEAIISPHAYEIDKTPHQIQEGIGEGTKIILTNEDDHLRLTIRYPRQPFNFPRKPL